MSVNLSCNLLTHKSTSIPAGLSRTPVPGPIDRLPSLNYSLFSEQKLRKKLGELGISSTGLKHHLIRRHTEWVDLVNANCDSASPKSKQELLRDLVEWEKTQGASAPSLSTQKKRLLVMEKNFDRAGWSSAHGNDFQRLVEQARGPCGDQRRLEARQHEEGNTTFTSSAPEGGISRITPVVGGQNAPAEHNGPAVDRATIDRPAPQAARP